MLTSIPASVTRLLAGDACLNADRRPGMFLGATLLERSAVANNSTSRFTVAARNVLALGCLPGEAAGPPIWEMSAYFTARGGAARARQLFGADRLPVLLDELTDTLVA
jgi:hypothetical protein